MAWASTSWSRHLALAAVLGLASCGGGGGGGGSTEAPAPVPPSLRAPVEDLEALGPFPSWSDARSFGAVGDGIADDSTALQQALDDLTQPGRPVVLRLPAGTYRITRSLTITATANTYGLSVIGDDPATTRIVWDGAAGEPMLVVDGGFHSSFARITWDGRSRAGYGVAHWYNTARPVYGGSVEHADEVFVDMEIGIQGGRSGSGYGALDSEGQVRRVSFVRNSRAGLNVGSFNALNWWVWDSRFVDCARGVSNLFTVSDTPGEAGAGNFVVYRSVFERSTVADAAIQNGGWFGLYASVSSGSRRFFEAGQIGANGARVILQGNRVLNTTDPVAVDNGNLGPLILIDNQFRSAAGQTGPAVAIDTTVPGADVVSVGNRYTVADPIRRRYAEDRLLNLGDQRVERAAIDSALPATPLAPVRQARQVFEVAAGSGAVAIQSAIDAAVAAAAGGAVNPVVHLPAGSYAIDRSLLIPAGSAVQLAGDSIGTVLAWTGAGSGPMLRLAGPSRATVRDLRFVGAGQTAIAVDRADQEGGRILVVGSFIGPTAASELLRTRLAMQANTAFATLSLNRVLSALSLGVGGLGPVSLAGNSQLMLSDSWFEGPETALFRLASGRLTYRGGQMAPGDARFGPAPVQPAIGLDGYAGTATFMGLEMTLPAAGNGIRVANETGQTNALFLGVEANRAGYFDRPAGGGRVGLLSSRVRTPDSQPVADSGSADAGFVTEALSQSRAMSWDDAPRSAPAGATDLRLYRVMTADTAQGLRIDGAP